MSVPTIPAPMVVAPGLGRRIATALTFIGAAIATTVMVVLGLDPENI